MTMLSELSNVCHQSIQVNKRQTTMLFPTLRIAIQIIKLCIHANEYYQG